MTQISLVFWWRNCNRYNKIAARVCLYIFYQFYFCSFPSLCCLSFFLLLRTSSSSLYVIKLLVNYPYRFTISALNLESHLFFYILLSPSFSLDLDTTTIVDPPLENVRDPGVTDTIDPRKNFRKELSVVKSDSAPLLTRNLQNRMLAAVRRVHSRLLSHVVSRVIVSFLLTSLWRRRWPDRKLYGLLSSSDFSGTARLSCDCLQWEKIITEFKSQTICVHDALL